MTTRLVQVARLELAASSASPPFAVPGVRLADGAAALHTDRGNSLASLHLPPAALGSLPQSRRPALSAGCLASSPHKQIQPKIIARITFG